MTFIQCCTRFRESKRLVTIVIFVALMLDLIMLTALAPILPSIIYNMENPNSSHSVVEVNGSMNGNSSETSDLLGVTDKVGVIMALKPGTEILANMVIGYLVDRFGHKYPLVLGCLLGIVATLGFAFVNSFWLLVLTTVVHAVASSLAMVSGLALLAYVFQGDQDRSRANSIALSGLNVGLIVGYPFGSTTYQFLGRPAPFIILAFLMLVDGVLRLVYQAPVHSEPSTKSKASMRVILYLIMDPYIAIALGCNVVQHAALGILMTTEPAWMIDTLHAEQWGVGIILCAGSVFQLGAQIVTGTFVPQKRRWLFCIAAPVSSAAGMIVLPFCTNMWQVLGPELLFRSGQGIILGIISPLLGYIVDKRHNSNYGAMYGLYALSYNIGLIVGPLFGGSLINILTFKWLYVGIGIVLALYSGLCVFIKNLEGDEPSGNAYELLEN